jgi:hypothetical protein
MNIHIRYTYTLPTPTQKIQVARSIPDGFIGITHSVRTMGLGSTQPLTEMSTSNISWGVNAAGA